MPVTDLASLIDDRWPSTSAAARAAGLGDSTLRRVLPTGRGTIGTLSAVLDAANATRQERLAVLRSLGLLQRPTGPRGYIGVDPGAQGGVARLCGGSVAVARAYSYHRSPLSFEGAVAALRTVGAQAGDYVAVEDLGVRPGESARGSQISGRSWVQWEAASRELGLLYSVRQTLWADKWAQTPQRGAGRAARKAAVKRWAKAHYEGVVVGARGAIHDGVADALVFARAIQAYVAQGGGAG